MCEELALGITPLPHMNAKDEIMQCQLEINFIECVVRPVWEHMAGLFPSVLPCLAQIDINRAFFQRRYTQMVAAQKAAAAAAAGSETAEASGGPAATTEGADTGGL